MNNIKNIIAISSGKGGVGKSSIATNIALALSRQGLSIGLLDADIYGPNIPRMLGISSQSKVSMIDGKFIPFNSHNIETISIALMSSDEPALVWRGPMASGACMKLIENTSWSNLDYLIIDLPPGTGDIQLTLSKKVKLTGAIVVTTPQDISLLDVKKGIEMFKKINIQCLGVIENMSGYVCSKCDNKEAIFGSGGGKKLSQGYSIPLLGSIPLSSKICSSMDEGKPIVYHDPDSVISHYFLSISKKIIDKTSSLSNNV